MRKLIEYFKEAYIELKDKVSWPAWVELQTSAIVVLVASMIIAVILLAMDMSANKILSAYYGNP